MQEPFLLRASDIKQYLYCPRILYFYYVLPVPRPVTPKMELGSLEHLELDRLEKRRKLKRYGISEGERIFHAQLTSERLRFEGKLDLHIKAGRELFPVEFKHSREAHLNQKYQLCAYAMLLEDKYQVPVRSGFLYLIPNSEILEVRISQEMRDFVKEITARIFQLIASPAWPKPTAKPKRCLECEFRRYCLDVGIY